jgi:hypothetical protein
MYRYARWLVLFGLLATAAPVEAQTTVTFQQGVGGYTAYQDSQIRETMPDSVLTDNPNNPGQIRVDGEDGGGVVYGLLRFNNIFGTGAGQIPLGSTITAATLSFDFAEDGINSIFLFHRMITDWSDTNASWNFFGGNGVTLGTEAVQAPDLTAGDGTFTFPLGANNFNVLSSLQAWSGGFANRGWIFRPSSVVDPVTDGILFRSAEDATANLRPRLSVTFTPIPEPSVLALAGLGLGTFGVARYRRWRAKPLAA